MTRFISWFNSKVKNGLALIGAVALIVGTMGIPNIFAASGGDGTPTGNGYGTSFPPDGSAYEQSCPKEMGDGCTFHPGTNGLFWSEPLQRNVTQVGIVKGVEIDWNGNTARAFQASDDESRCSLVVLASNSTFIGLHIVDANIHIYNIWAGDVAGWTKTLAVQAAQEQTADHGCPERSYPDDFDTWTSTITSPPCGVSGFDCGIGTNLGNPGTKPGKGNPGADNGNGSKADETHGSNGQLRKQTSDFGGTLAFQKGDSVDGGTIHINGKDIGPCHYESAPDRGKVTNGVVNYWTAEVHTPPC